MKNKLITKVMVISLVLVSAMPVHAVEFEFQSGAQLLMDLASGEILYENNTHEKMYPASITKIMTMLLAMEALESGKVTLDEMIPISEQAAAHGGSQIFLSPGDRVSFTDLMIGIVVGSANDGAWALAEYLAGSVDAFVEQMNAKAQELGMKNTHFVNPHGLHDENHYTTAYDVALMSRELTKYPQILEWASFLTDEEFLKGKIKKAEGVYLSYSNNLVRYYDGCTGLKTGFTNEAGYCVAATDRREETHLLAVIMKAPGRPVLFNEARELLNWGFANYQSVPIIEGGAVVGKLPVDKGQLTMVEVVAAEDLALLLPKGSGDDYERLVELPERLPAPLTPPKAVGKLIIKSADGEELGSVSLVPKAEVARATFTTFFSRCLSRWLQFDRH